jgi:hypothetical protein
VGDALLPDGNGELEANINAELWRPYWQTFLQFLSHSLKQSCPDDGQSGSKKLAIWAAPHKLT